VKCSEQERTQAFLTAVGIAIAIIVLMTSTIVTQIFAIKYAGFTLAYMPNLKLTRLCQACNHDLERLQMVPKEIYTLR